MKNHESRDVMKWLAWLLNMGPVVNLCKMNDWMKYSLFAHYRRFDNRTMKLEIPRYCYNRQAALLLVSNIFQATLFNVDLFNFQNTSNWIASSSSALITATRNYSSFSTSAFSKMNKSCTNAKALMCLRSGSLITRIVLVSSESNSIYHRSAGSPIKNRLHLDQEVVRLQSCGAMFSQQQV